jgi:hypothetical protein
MAAHFLQPQICIAIVAGRFVLAFTARRSAAHSPLTTALSDHGSVHVGRGRSDGQLGGVAAVSPGGSRPSSATVRRRGIPRVTSYLTSAWRAASRFRTKLGTGICSRYVLQSDLCRHRPELNGRTPPGTQLRAARRSQVAVTFVTLSASLSGSVVSLDILLSKVLISCLDLSG